METPLSSTLSTLRAVGGRSSSELSPNTKKVQGLEFKFERAAPQSSHQDWFWGLVTQATAGREPSHLGCCDPWKSVFPHVWLLVPPPCSQEGDLGQQLSAHLSHLAPGLPSGPLAPPSSFPELLALTFGAVLACVAHFAGTAVGPVAGQAVAAAPTGAREAGVTH